ncbi:PIG-L family deacetylase [Mycobacterium sp. SVM_VP21]|uniref:LmbE family protein [Intrasporangium calvum DSM] n=2 Tax=Mycobacteriaceae TaxID=1762 RepID=A0A375YW92_MYCSH|nr:MULTISPECIES: PIG-L deacetylase family protein [Mycobacteriaceae]ORA75541.1 GlcNAc-PI de-N-acetylase [Mycolicibacter kumamotonensis]UVO14171.1 PIG-L family deacetylase [Mycobacterium sp. SVM_VP21]SRX93107.1 LmbE family protein [Intrasporangium calvum DSM] [Mycobacterium shimoidei]
MTNRELPEWRSVLVVVAHPDDESFGLGAILSAFADQGAKLAVLCLTRGEASTLHGVTGDLRDIRAGELAAAAEVLGVSAVQLLDYPDGHLADTLPEELTMPIIDFAERFGAQGLLVFDPSGITGHPDHRQATAAARAAAAEVGLPVLGWTLPTTVADALNGEYHTSFVGHGITDIDLIVPVNRRQQYQAVRRHLSQALPTSVLWRRLELLGPFEHLRWLPGTLAAA